MSESSPTILFYKWGYWDPERVRIRSPPSARTTKRLLKWICAQHDCFQNVAYSRCLWLISYIHIFSICSSNLVQNWQVHSIAFRFSWLTRYIDYFCFWLRELTINQKRMRKKSIWSIQSVLNICLYCTLISVWSELNETLRYKNTI